MKIKIIFPFRSYPTGNRKFQNNSKKIKKLKNTITGSFQDKIGWRRPRKTENKSYRSVSFLSGTKQKIKKKNSKKIKKYHYEFVSNQNKLENDEKERK